MIAIVRKLTSMLGGKGSAVALPEIAVRHNLGTRDEDRPFLEWSASLARAGSLLLVPSPQAVRDAATLIHGVQSGFNRYLESGSCDHSSQEVSLLIQELKRTHALLLGANRVQWTSMRRVLAVTQSYAPGGRVSQWKPALPTVDVNV